MKLTKLLAGTLLVAAWVVGCASVDFDYPKPESHAVTDTEDTFLGQQITPVVAAHPADESGFYPMNDGIDAVDCGKNRPYRAVDGATFRLEYS